MFIKDWKKDLFTIPNMLSLFRLLLIPVYIVIYLNAQTDVDYYIAGGILAVSCLTDMIDGQIARRFNQVSDFGKFLDPLADKLLTIAAMVMFCEWGMMPGWALMLVLTREFAVTGLRLVAVGKGTVIAAGWSGKVKTASTMVGLCVWMAFPTIDWLGWVVTGVIVATTVYSGVEYFIQNWKCLLRDGDIQVPLCYRYLRCRSCDIIR